MRIGNGNMVWFFRMENKVFYMIDGIRNKYLNYVSRSWSKGMENSKIYILVISWR